jgi:hypothetical protein
VDQIKTRFDLLNIYDPTLPKRRTSLRMFMGSPTISDGYVFRVYLSRQGAEDVRIRAFDTGGIRLSAEQEERVRALIPLLASLEELSAGAYEIEQIASSAFEHPLRAIQFDRGGLTETITRIRLSDRDSARGRSCWLDLYATVKDPEQMLQESSLESGLPKSADFRTSAGFEAARTRWEAGAGRQLEAVKIACAPAFLSIHERLNALLPATLVIKLP